MSFPELEEFASEDLGFRLVTEKEGFHIFLDPIDFDALADWPLHLLAVGHTKNIYAASNTREIVIGSLRDLDGENPQEKLKRIELESTTHLSLSHDNETLFTVSGGDVHLAKTEEIVGGTANFEEITSSGKITAVEASPTSPAYFYLSKDKTLTLSSGKTVSGVNAAAWQTNGTQIAAVTNTEFKLLAADGAELLTHGFSDAGTLSAVSSIDSGNWFVVGQEEGADAVNLVVSVANNAVGDVSSVLLTPPFGDAERAEALYAAAVTNWKLNTSYTFVTSALSTDISTVECGAHRRLVTQINDTDRAELPMDDDSGDDTLPVGFALDLSSTRLVVKEPCQAVEEAVGVLPRLLCLSNLGHLLVWYVFDSAGLKTEDLSLTRALDSAKAGSDSIDSGKPEKKEPKAETSPVEPAKIEELNDEELKTEKEPESTDKVPSDSAKLGSPLASESKEDKPAFGSTGFGSSGFGSSGFGSSGKTSSAFGLTGFGSSGFGLTAAASTAAASDKPKDAGEPAFGKSSFGQSSFGQSSFGQPSFGAATPFGSSGFGSKPAAETSSSKPSGFASFGTTSASFSSSKAKDSPFGAVSAKESPFGSVAAKESPFGSTKPSTDSPFGSTKPSTDSPFGLTKTSMDSPFGLTKTSTDSPFGGFKLTENPFASSKSSTESPFKTKPSNDLPFGALKPKETSFGPESTKTSLATSKPSEAPFGIKPSTDSPFGAVKSSGSVFGETKSTDAAKPSDESTKKESVFGSTKTPFANPFDKLKISESDKSKDSESTAKEKPAVEQKEETKVKVEEDPEVKVKEEPEVKVKEEPTSEVKQDTKAETTAEAKPQIKFDIKEKPNLAPVTKSKTAEEDAEEHDFEVVDLPQADPKVKIEQTESEEVQSPIKAGEPQPGYVRNITAVPTVTGDEDEDDEEEEEEEEQEQDPVDHLDNELVIVSGNSEAEGEILSLEEDDFVTVPKIEIEPLLLFDGWTKEPRKFKNPISDKINDLLITTEGKAAILDLNVTILEDLIEVCEFNAIELEEDDLEFPSQWTLGNIDTLTQFAQNIGTEVTAKLEAVKAQDQKLRSALELAEKSEVIKEQLGRIVSQIAVFKQEAESPRLVNRPLDVQAQTLCYTLRKKLRLVQEQHESALDKMVQLTLKQQANRDFVDKLEQVVYEIHARTKEYTKEIAKLESQLLQIPALRHTSAVGITHDSQSFKALETQKRKLAAKFSGGGNTRTV